MKTRMLIIVVLIMAVLIVAGSCATDPMKDISKDYEIYGTWINPDAKPVNQFGKLVFNPNGMLESYNTPTSTSFLSVPYYITNKWIDSMENIWYTLIIDMGIEIGYIYALAIISDSGKTLEMSISKSDYPREIDPKYTEYHIVYRQ